MPFNLFTVAGSITPIVINTFFHHYLRKPIQHPAQEQLSYDEGIHLIRQFLKYASFHRIDDIQSFTTGYIPHPPWVHLTTLKIPHKDIDKAAELLITYLGLSGIAQIGGQKWWQWRAKELEAEWIEMESHFLSHLNDPSSVPKRTLLYVHGGVYFINSVATERYQIQRHARNLNCRAFAPNYRLAPQYPFPCAVLDVLAAYVYLLDTCHLPAAEILVSGDSAGGALILGLLCLLRDVGLPLPAGAMLISPWVDLLHSFPSIMGDNTGDYVPNDGFHYVPSMAWPPPSLDELLQFRASRPVLSEKLDISGSNVGKEQSGVNITSRDVNGSEDPQKLVTTSSPFVTVQIDGKTIEVKDQIQLVAPNDILDHPLLSPVTQASLGGLCPILIVTGGGELLRDEQIYVAHKAAQPSKYPTAEVHLKKYPEQRRNVDKFEGTKVFLQVFDDCAHVTPTLSFTRPAKYMYLSIANFGIWCTTQQTTLPTQLSTTPTTTQDTRHSSPANLSVPGTEVTMTGILPEFQANMIRQRVSAHGQIRPMEPASEMPALNMAPEQICVIHPGPTKRWLAAQGKWDARYTKQTRRIKLAREREYAERHDGRFLGGDLDGERPPPSALAARPSTRKANEMIRDIRLERQPRKNHAGWIWGTLCMKEDRKIMERGKRVD